MQCPTKQLFSAYWGLAPIVSADLHATEAAVILSSTHKRLAVLVNCYTTIINSS